MATKIAVVTGANKGIGFEIAKQLLESHVTVVIGCRSATLGEAAVQQFHSMGFSQVEFIQLDISDVLSIESFAKAFGSRHSHLDILINNAAIAFKGSDPTPFADQARPTMNVNYFGTLKFTHVMWPFLDRSTAPRVVNVCSEAGHLRILPTAERQAEFSSEQLTEEQCSDLALQFVAAVENGTHSAQGWPNTCYGMSKLVLIALTKVWARNHLRVLINGCCPGYCDTDMSSHLGPRPAAVGAETPVYLALSEDIRSSGGFYANKQEISW